MEYPGKLFAALSLSLFLFLLLLLPASGSDLIEVLPVNSRILRLTFDDGYVENRGTGNDLARKWPLDLEDALRTASYLVISPDDPQYADGLAPAGLGRKSKIHDVSSVCDWDGQKCLNTYIQHHYIYLLLPSAMANGGHYTIKVAGLADNLDEWSFVYDVKTTRSVAVHTNHLGYSPRAAKRYAYISQWMGDLGPLDMDLFEGSRFDICPVNPGGTPGGTVFNGQISKQKDYETGTPDSDKPDVGPGMNFVKSDVWECDFSGFDTPGEYILSIENVGCSYPFRIHDDAAHEAFYHAARALYFERAITALPEAYAGIYHRPEWTGRHLVYTPVRTMDLTDESGKNQKQNIFDRIDYSFDVDSIRGWYHDAGDWDGYFSHFRVPRSLMHAYELAPENFNDGELNIPESQEMNGFGNTRLPDILDEAVWLVDYFRHNIGPTGGIFGSRVHPDISDRSGLTDAASHESQGFVFKDDSRPLTTSFADYRTWIVHGEDPRDSYAFASIAAQYVHCLKIASVRTGEDYSALMADYLESAENACDWASANTLAGDEEARHFVENRAAAAAWLYKVTGAEKYLDRLKTDLSYKNITASTTDPGESKWAVWAYATIDGSDPLYAGTFDAALQSDLVRVVEKYAYKRVVESIRDRNRSMRMGGDFSQPVWNGQATTPWILPAMVAHRVTGSQEYLDACFLTADYFLGGNQLNYTWLTGIGHEHPIHILHVDSRQDNIFGNIPGIPPYSPRTRCDWMQFQGNSCDYGGPWDNDFFLLDGRIYPSYEDDNGQTQWPVHELWFDQYTSPAGAEFTIHQNIAPAAAAYGFLCAPGGTAPANQAPLVTFSVDGTGIIEGDKLEIQVSAGDPDGWIYKTELYGNNRLVKTIHGAVASITWENIPAGSNRIFVKVTDNMGRWTTTDTITLQVAENPEVPGIVFNMEESERYGITGRTVTLDVTVTGNVDTVRFYNDYELIGTTLQVPYDLQWTPQSRGEYKIRAEATDSGSGLTAGDHLFFWARDRPYLLDLRVPVLQLEPVFDPDIFAYTLELPLYVNDPPVLRYESVTGSTVILQEAAGIDQRVYVSREERTTVIRVEEEGDPSNFSEYRVTYRLNTGAPPSVTDTILFETFGDEDSGFDGLASDYTKFSSAGVAGFIADSVQINEWWQVSPVDRGASGEAKLWLTRHADAGDTLHLTGIDISGYTAITGLSWWSFANTGWTGYYTKAPATEISVDGGEYRKLFIPGELDAAKFNCQSQWGKLDLSLNVPLNGSAMTFRIGTYDDQQWMIDDILLLTETGECYSTLRSLGLSSGSLDYDPDVLTYHVELDTNVVPEVNYAPTNEEAVVTVTPAVAVNQNTHPLEADRTTTVSVANCGGQTDYRIVFTTTIAGFREVPRDNLQVFPNPAERYITLKGAETSTRIEIWNLPGLKLRSLPLDGKPSRIDIADLPAGIYIVKIFNGEAITATFKLVKTTGTVNH